MSACLLGEAVRYNGGDMHRDDDILQRWLREGRIISVCPEFAGSLPVSRPRAGIANGADGMEVFGEARLAEADKLLRQFEGGLQPERERPC